MKSYVNPGYIKQDAIERIKQNATNRAKENGFREDIIAAHYNGLNIQEIASTTKHSEDMVRKEIVYFWKGL